MQTSVEQAYSATTGGDFPVLTGFPQPAPELATAQRGNGTSQSRPFPARPVKLWQVRANDENAAALAGGQRQDEVRSASPEAASTVFCGPKPPGYLQNTPAGNPCPQFTCLSKPSVDAEPVRVRPNSREPLSSLREVGVSDRGSRRDLSDGRGCGLPIKCRTSNPSETIPGRDRTSQTRLAFANAVKP